MLKVYYPSILVGTATCASMVAGAIIGKKTEASLTATALLLDSGYRKYKSKAKYILGDKAKDIEKAVREELFEENKSELER